MTRKLRHKIVYEIVWLVGIIMISAATEYVIIELFDLHPILSVKVQGFIGLLLIAYGIRMIARMSKKGIIVLVDDDEHSPHRDNEK